MRRSVSLVIRRYFDQRRREVEQVARQLMGMHPATGVAHGVRYVPYGAPPAIHRRRTAAERPVPAPEPPPRRPRHTVPPDKPTVPRGGGLCGGLYGAVIDVSKS